MRRLLLGVTIVALMLPMPARAGTVLLSVHDGEFFYDSTNDGVCNPDTNAPTGAVAVRHWHVGVPFVGASSEVAGGFGCLGGGTNWQPQSWTVTVTGTAQVAGTITYTWDTNVPGGCCNDVHLQVMDSQGGLVQSTVLTDGLKPVIPVVMQVRSHSFDFTLPAGTYTIYEDIFSGEHTAWLSNFTIVDSV